MATNNSYTLEEQQEIYKEVMENMKNTSYLTAAHILIEKELSIHDAYIYIQMEYGYDYEDLMHDLILTGELIQKMLVSRIKNIKEVHKRFRS